MRSFAIIMLHTLFVQATAEEGLADKLVNKLTNKLMEKADLDGTTLGKASSGTMLGQPINLAAVSRGVTPFRSPASPATLANVHAIQDKLSTYGMASSKMQERALTAIAGMRNVCAAAQKKPVEVRSDIAGFKEPIKINAKDMAGVSAPLGFWDPWGISTKFSDGGALLFFREAELKHGRICMLATLGIFVGEKFHPFFGGNIDMPAYNVRSMFLETDFKGFWLGALALIGYVESLAIRNAYDTPFWEFDLPKDGGATNFFSTQLDKKDRIPGDIGYDPLRLKPKDPAELKELQTKEINNGRLAMLATIGMLAQELVTGEKIFN